MIKLGVLYGGKSTEREVSRKSAKSVLDNLNKEKYEIYPIFIDENGTWFEENETEKIEIENVIKYLKNLDVVFPVLHGLWGEDGTIQGLFEIAGVKYVGCKVLASSIGMDKAYTKIIFEKANIKQTKYLYIKKYRGNKYIYIDGQMNEKLITMDELLDIAEK